MAVYLGSTEIQKIYHGSNEVDTARIGATGIFSSAPPDLEATLTISAFAVGRDARIRAFITDLNGIRSITSATLTARDGQTRTLSFTRTDANTFTSETLNLRNSRWVSGSLAVVFVDNTSGATHTVSENYVEITGRATRVGATGLSQTTALASHAGVLYTVDSLGSNADLYTLNITTGVPSKVGTSVRFGRDVRSVGGMTSHNGTLYMAGFTGAGNALYTVDTTTGIATRTSTNHFGFNVTGNGIASHNGNLYIIDAGSQILYTVNPTTGIATRIGAGNLSQPQGLTSHNGELLATRFSNLNIVDVNTGGLTTIGSNYSGLTFALGIASHNGTLYAVGQNILYTIS